MVLDGCFSKATGRKDEWWKRKRKLVDVEPERRLIPSLPANVHCQYIQNISYGAGDSEHHWAPDVCGMGRGGVAERSRETHGLQGNSWGVAVSGHWPRNWSQVNFQKLPQGQLTCLTYTTNPTRILPQIPASTSVRRVTIFHGFLLLLQIQPVLEPWQISYSAISRSYT